MPLLSTTIGAYPKPDYVPTPDWFRGESTTDPDPTRGLESFETTKVILGVVVIARSRVETVEEIQGRLGQALEHINKAHLIAAPDCGLGLLDGSTTVAKLSNMVAAARAFS
jgi:methionine synthase II (cobalamin-independent)